MSRQGHPGFELTGGALCLDFANTVDSRSDRVRRQEHLHRYSDLLAWCRQSRALTLREIAGLALASRKNPQTARRMLQRTTRLREAIYRIFSAVARGKSPQPADMALLNSVARSALAHRELARRGGRFAWVWEKNGQRLDRVLWPVARSAADLLSSEQLPWVRECAAETCSWLFLDHSRNRSRRWCDMKVCGNREKARRFYRRTQRTA